jgi:hypothetical protein
MLLKHDFELLENEFQVVLRRRLRSTPCQSKAPTHPRTPSGLTPGEEEEEEEEEEEAGAEGKAGVCGLITSPHWVINSPRNGSRIFYPGAFAIGWFSMSLTAPCKSVECVLYS